MRYAYENIEPDIDESAFVAPSVVLVGKVSLGARSSIWFNSVVRGDINAITIGQDTNIQDGCLLHVTSHNPLVIADRVTAGHGAILHGCHIQSDCLIAMGAIILDGAVVGRGSIVAAGAVVSPGMIIPEESLVMGIPGKVVRSVNADDRANIVRGWQNYVGYSDTYRKMGAQPLA